MGVDVTIGDMSFNYTHNVSGLWHDHLNDGDTTGFMALHGKTGRQSFVLLMNAFNNIDSSISSMWNNEAVGEPNFCAKYDAKNGWGSTVGGLVFMARVMAACAYYPRHKVHVSV